MRAKTFAAASLVVLGAWPAAAEKLPEEFRFGFEKAYRPGLTFAVVVQPGVPTTSIYGVKGDQTNAHYSVDILDGQWKSSGGLLDTDQTAVDFLMRGEVMELASTSYKDNRVDMRFVSLEAKKVSRGSGWGKSEKREPVATNFKFFFPVPKSKVMTAADVPMALEYVGAFLRPFRDEASARAFSARLVAGTEGATAPRPSAAERAPAAPTTAKKEIKVGMTALEVIDVLGKPQKEVTFQNATRWTYPDLTVIFENGRVKEVRF
jgi:hypothetical protein